MAGLEMLLAEFEEAGLSAGLHQQFKDLALALKDLPVPLNLRAVRALVDARRIAARAG